MSARPRRVGGCRLFLYNAGGSHHFAGAAYIAGQLRRRVPLRASLEVIELREEVGRSIDSRLSSMT
ncbi:DUF6685 family protein [Paraburkholderia caledonica]|uniref:DUF6685 family protein n=1 Tax=Paraburkholderia caledonica TaxID=134536 RepID=UPI0038CD1800